MPTRRPLAVEITGRAGAQAGGAQRRQIRRARDGPARCAAKAQVAASPANRAENARFDRVTSIIAATRRSIDESALDGWFALLPRAPIGIRYRDHLLDPMLAGSSASRWRCRRVRPATCRSAIAQAIGWLSAAKHAAAAAPARCSPAFRPLLEDPSILKIGQNIKYDLHVLGRSGITLAPLDDTLLISYALDCRSQGHGMDDCRRAISAMNP